MRPTAGKAALRPAQNFWRSAAVRLAQEERGRFQIVAGVHEFLHRARGRPVHHLKARRHYARPDDIGHRIAGFLDVVERSENDPRRLRLGQELDRDLGRDREHALRPDHERKQVEPGGVERLAAELDDLALDRDRAHPQHIVQGEAVFQAVHAARVLGDVAADRAGDLRGRIGRVEKPAGRSRLRDREIGDAGLHARRARHRVEREDAPHFRERQQHAVTHGERPAREAGAGAAGDDRHFQLVAGGEHLPHFLFVRGQRHHHRQLPVSREAVALRVSSSA